MRTISRKKSEYQSANLSKYQSRNPLKRLLTFRMSKAMDSLLQTQTGKFGAPLNILDAGCGEGVITRRLAGLFPDAQIIGMDLSAEAVAYAAGLSEENIVYCTGSVYACPFAKRQFNITVCSEVLEHLDEPERAVHELERVTENCLLISVPWEPWFRLGNLLSGKNITRLGNPEDHIQHWTGNGFKAWIRAQFPRQSVVFTHSFPWSFAVIDMSHKDGE